MNDLTRAMAEQAMEQAETDRQDQDARSKIDDPDIKKFLAQPLQYETVLLLHPSITQNPIETMTIDQRREAFVAELTNLSRKYGIVVRAYEDITLDEVGADMIFTEKRFSDERFVRYTTRGDLIEHELEVVEPKP